MSDKSNIPKGHYCYEEDPFGDPDLNGGEMPVRYCPYSTFKTINGVNVPWCSFLEKGGVENGISEGDYSKLIDHYGIEEKLEEELPLFLLWDSVKECGENYDYDEEN
jgi:hypothetical protein